VPGKITTGHAENISLAEDGSILLAPLSKEILPGDEAISTPPLLLSLETDGRGNTFVGGGLGARVLRINSKGEIHALFESSGVGVRALSSDLAGNLLVATLPNGTIYRVDEEGSAEVFFEPEERYLWALATDAFDRTYLATGERGVVYSVAGPGEATVFFDSDEPHITSLAADPTGRLLAGSAGRGLLYRIGRDGHAEVVLNSGLHEISSIAVASDGTVYASAIRSPGPRGPRRRVDGRQDLTIEVPAEPEDEVLEETTGPSRKVVLDLAEIFPVISEEQERRPLSRIYRISPGRTPVAIWTSGSEWTYAIALDARGHLLMGTGPFGRLYRLEPDGTSTLLRRYPASQITSLAPGEDRKTYLLTSNPGRAYVLEQAPAEMGRYISPVHDAGNVASWGTLQWEADLPKGTRIAFVARSGNTSVPDETWSGWTEAVSDAAGSPVNAPPARHVQWRVTLSRLKTEASPILRNVALTYLPENLSPMVSGVTVGDPGVRPGAGEPARKGAESTEDAGQFPERALWISWHSSDPDGDPLRHAVSIRKEEESAWMVLAKDLERTRIALDPTGHREGRYVARIEVTDVEENGDLRALKGSARSGPFVVDNTPPDIQASEPEVGEQSLSLVFQARDALSAVTQAEWSPGADSPWTAVLPDDGIGDTVMESFKLTLDLTALDRQIRLRVTDAAGNAATTEVPLPRWR
jgi:sugar lactone lactonase YvrE